MKVTILGGWDTDDAKNRDWDLRIDEARKRALQDFSRTLGRLLARARHDVIVGSDDVEKSVDPYIVEGIGEELAKEAEAPALVSTIDGIDPDRRLFTDARFDEVRRVVKTFPLPRADQWPRAAAKIASVREADVAIAIAGLSDTYVAGIAALVAGKRVVPVAVYGGAAAQLYDACERFNNWDLPGSLAPAPEDRAQLLYTRTLDEGFATIVIRLAGLDRAAVFLGYSSHATSTAVRVREFLEAQLGLRVVDWQRDFTTGRVILSEIEKAARACKYAVFLFTPADTVVTPAGELQMVPRDNVVFEAGFFMRSHAATRTVIVVEGDTKVLADYGGHIYLRIENPDDISPIEQRLRESFKDDVRGANRSSG